MEQYLLQDHHKPEIKVSAINHQEHMRNYKIIKKSTFQWVIKHIQKHCNNINDTLIEDMAWRENQWRENQFS